MPDLTDAEEEKGAAIEGLLEDSLRGGGGLEGGGGNGGLVEVEFGDVVSLKGGRGGTCGRCRATAAGGLVRRTRRTSAWRGASTGRGAVAYFADCDNRFDEKNSEQKEHGGNKQQRFSCLESVSFLNHLNILTMLGIFHYRRRRIRVGFRHIQLRSSCVLLLLSFLRCGGSSCGWNTRKEK